MPTTTTRTPKNQSKKPAVAHASAKRQRTNSTTSKRWFKVALPIAGFALVGLILLVATFASAPNSNNQGTSENRIIQAANYDTLDITSAARAIDLPVGLVAPDNSATRTQTTCPSAPADCAAQIQAIIDSTTGSEPILIEFSSPDGGDEAVFASTITPSSNMTIAGIDQPTVRRGIGAFDMFDLSGSSNIYISGFVVDLQACQGSINNAVFAASGDTSVLSNLHIDNVSAAGGNRFNESTTGDTLVNIKQYGNCDFLNLDDTATNGIYVYNVEATYARQFVHINGGQHETIGLFNNQINLMGEGFLGSDSASITRLELAGNAVSKLAYSDRNANRDNLHLVSIISSDGSRPLIGTLDIHDNSFESPRYLSEDVKTTRQQHEPQILLSPVDSLIQIDSVAELNVADNLLQFSGGDGLVIGSNVDAGTIKNNRILKIDSQPIVTSQPVSENLVITNNQTTLLP